MDKNSLGMEEVESDLGSDFDFVQEVQGLSQWELLNSSDADSEYHLGEEGACDVVFDDLRVEDLPVLFVHTSFRGIENSRVSDSHENNNIDYDLGGANDEYDDDVDDGDICDLDDEQVPWSVSGKFQRQRMRKLGKRSFAKMFSSKRSPYLFVRPGCVRGKHSLGLKHNY